MHRTHFLCTQAAAKVKETVSEPVHTLLETVRDAFLFQGDFNWLWWVCLSGFCLVNCSVILNNKAGITFSQGVALAVLTNYGGSTLAAIICGHPVVFLVNQALVPVRA
jgi:hypothetical protein